MRYTRREAGKLALNALPAALLARPFVAQAQARPNSVVNGVNVGAITYSYRTMPDQSAEATLKYSSARASARSSSWGDLLKRLRARRQRRKAAVAAAAVSPQLPSSRPHSMTPPTN